jgi:hypothetical protein
VCCARWVSIRAFFSSENYRANPGQGEHNRLRILVDARVCAWPLQRQRLRLESSSRRLVWRLEIESDERARSVSRWHLGPRAGTSWASDETMERDRAYLVRYGLAGHVGRFPFDFERSHQALIERGQSVVVLTDRGLELGEVLVAPDGLFPPPDHAGRPGGPEAASCFVPAADAELSHDPNGPRLLRPAAPADLENARRSEVLRSERFQLCQRILGDGSWTLDLVDVEPLLDQNTTVLHVLGSFHSNLAALRAEFRSRSGFDVLLEPAGTSSGIVPGNAEGPEPASSTQEPVPRCGDCSCQDGGCGKAVAAGKAFAAAVAMPKDETPASCGVSSSHSACASCGVSKWVADKRQSRK